ncbi:LysM peptidoglycan-binding domain-containing protein [Roseibium sediminis]|uniref:LysM peptidoglycan-binding domain-containing protein n=1 Tax=Roseibium sediminis TaxID=1775174 RepID=UPI00123D2426|nr:LysM peptidoglycan-binding domain-containing protein [Roseibium sediminis]
MRQNVVWALIAAFVVGAGALGVGYFQLKKGEGSEIALKDDKASNAVSKSASETASGGETAENAGGATDPVATGQGDASQTAESGAGDATKPEESLSFDVVGVEPTGEGVIAGRSDAGAIIALRANGQVVGKGVANSAGEWTIILDKPLEPGDYDMALEVQGEDGKVVSESSQRLAVSIPEGGNGQPLVVLNTPDAPSNILQKPEETVVAAAAPVEDAKPEAGAAPEVAASAEATTTAGQLATAVETAVSGVASETAKAVGEAVDAGSVTVAAAEKTAETVVEGVAEAGQAAISASGQIVANVTEEVATLAGSSASADMPVDASATSGTETAADAAPAADAAGAPKVTVEAVESEEGKVFVAGTGEPGSSVRVYVDDKFAGEAPVSGTGRWLLEGKENISEGNVEVRADLVEQGADKVEARAAVTFEKEAPQQIVLTKVVATGEASADGSAGATVTKALPNVIIRKGDNLWRISRRLYGDGFRYTTIYQANKVQIRNPDLIYPGQVFLTPENDVRWDNEAKNEGVAVQ